MTQKSEIAAWFAAHDAYHKASDAYNARHAVITAARDRGDWSGDLELEYRKLSDAQRHALKADETLYAALKINPPTVGPSTRE